VEPLPHEPRAREGLVAAVRQRAADFVAAGALLRPRERALLMLSGGADSMALLDIVRDLDQRLGLGLELSALHVDYATRGAASTRDRAIVADACAGLGVALHVVRLPSKPVGPDFQERARRIRYDAARELVAQGRADVVVTAHNRDDQAETVLYRLVKYAAPSALRGMRPRDDGVVRPLLTVGAGELRAYCAARAIAYGHDESNDTTAYRRNLLRHEVLPVLARVNPRVTEALAEAAALAERDHEALVAAADEAWARVARPVPAGPGDAPWALDLAALAAQPAALRTLCLRRLALSALGDGSLLDRRATSRLEDLAAGRAGSRVVPLRDEREAVREYDVLTVRARPAAHDCAPVTLPAGAAAAFCGRRFRAELVGGARYERTTAEAWLAVDHPEPTVLLRHPRPGDRLRPFGMAADALLSDLFTAARVPRSRRASAVLAEVDGRPAWVFPGRSSEWFRVRPDTPYTLHIFAEATEAT
jgi:tRNA(Ile)-lysidine synthase